MTTAEILLEVDRRASGAMATGFGAFVSALLRKRHLLEHHWTQDRVEKSAQATCRGARLYRRHWRLKRRHDNKLKTIYELWGREYFRPEPPLEPDNNYRCGKCRACLSQLFGVKEAEAQIKQAFVEGQGSVSILVDDLLDVLFGRVLHGTIR